MKVKDIKILIDAIGILTNTKYEPVDGEYNYDDILADLNNMSNICMELHGEDLDFRARYICIILSLTETVGNQKMRALSENVSEEEYAPLKRAGEFIADSFELIFNLKRVLFPKIPDELKSCLSGTNIKEAKMSLDGYIDQYRDSTIVYAMYEDHISGGQRVFKELMEKDCESEALRNVAIKMNCEVNSSFIELATQGLLNSLGQINPGESDGEIISESVHNCLTDLKICCQIFRTI